MIGSWKLAPALAHDMSVECFAGLTLRQVTEEDAPRMLSENF